jgi:hypothetical protein
MGLWGVRAVDRTDRRDGDGDLVFGRCGRNQITKDEQQNSAGDLRAPYKVRSTTSIAPSLVPTPPY